MERDSNGLGEWDLPGQTGALFDLVYADLRKAASHMLAAEGGGLTLQATALVHEAFLRFDRSSPQGWESRRHFFAAAVEAMRRVLIERARHKKTQRCGCGVRPISLDDVQVAESTPSETLLAVDDALERLALEDPVKAEVVKLRFFAGCSVAEVAELMGMAERTVKWHWTFARAWLLETILQTQAEVRCQDQDIVWDAGHTSSNRQRVCAA